MDVCVAVVQEEERRTGARVFVLSGAVGDDPLILFERDASEAVLESFKGDGDCAFDVTLNEVIGVSRVYEDGGAGIMGGFGVADGDARDFVFRQRGLIARGRLTKPGLSRKRGWGCGIRLGENCIAGESRKEQAGNKDKGSGFLHGG